MSVLNYERLHHWSDRFPPRGAWRAMGGLIAFGVLALPQLVWTSPWITFVCPAYSPYFTANSLALRTTMAEALFWSCDFSFWQLTTMPVGMWVSRTEESVVLTDWPPGPPDRNTSTRMS